MKKTFKNRRGQTTVEYALTTLALLMVFTSMYRFFGMYIPNQFRQGARVIVSMYTVDPSW